MAAKKKQTAVRPLASRVVRMANDTGLSGGAIVVTGSDLGVEGRRLGFVDGGRSRIAGGDVGVVVPSGIRGTTGDATPPLLVLADATATGSGEFTYTGSEGVVFERPWSVLPDRRWVVEMDWEVGTEWTPGEEWLGTDDWVPENPRDLSVLVPSDLESIARRVGADVATFREENGPVRTVQRGETLDREALLFGAFSDQPLFPDDPLFPPDSRMDTERLFDAGVPAPLPGVTYGFGVLATPDASVAGQSVNPLASISKAELLTHEQTQGTLRQAGVTDAGDVMWSDAPTAITGDVGSRLVSDVEQLREGQQQAELLGDETELTTFAGVVSGVDGPWAVAIDVARMNVDDVVFAVGVYRRPVGTEDATGVLTGAHLARARELTAETVRRLERR